MGLRTKFNLVMLSVFVAGLLISGVLSWNMLNSAARDEVIQNAGIMMGAAHAIRGYTVERVRPLIDLASHPEFVPETVPAFAATETFASLRQQYPEYRYREATLNPTNPRDRASDYEIDIIQQFRSDDQVNELVGERDTPQGRILWMARPIRITNPECLDCHSTVDAAPVSLINTYGEANGFGWQMGEVVGGQIVEVPMSLSAEKARRAFLLFMSSLTAVFVLLFAALNVSLSRMVIQPITRVSNVADQISLGHFEIEEFEEAGTDEIATLKASFNRMRRSLERAMEMIQD